MNKEELLRFIDSDLIEVKLIGNDGFDGQEIKDGKEYLKEQIAALDLSKVRDSFSADKLQEAYTDGFSDSRYDFDIENYR